MKKSSNKPSHLRALLKKNWIIWKRAPCVSCLEIAVPVVFVLALIMFRKIDTVDHFPQTTFWNNASEAMTLSGDLSNTDLSGFMKDCNDEKGGGKVALAPQGDSLVTDLNNAFQTAGFETMLFPDDAAINAYTSRPEYSKTPDVRLCFGVVVNKNNENDRDYEYVLRWNTSSIDEPDIPYTDEPRLQPISLQNLESFELYRTSGFLLVQNFIDNLILQREKLDTDYRIKPRIASRTLEPYIIDTLEENMNGQTRMFLDLPLLLPYLRFMNGILREKEQRIREGMRIMGLNNTAFYLSWFITYFIIFTIISILISIILAFQLFTASSFPLIVLWHWEYTMSLMALGFFLSVFFNKAKIGNVAGFVIALFLGFFESMVSQDSTYGQYFGISMAPQSSIGISASQILKLEAAQLGIQASTLNVEIEGYKLSIHFLALALDIAIFLILGFYLDRVLPSEFGIRSHPLFCLMRKKNKKQAVVGGGGGYDEGSSYLIKNANVEEVDEALKLQDEANESIKVQNLKKVYSNSKLAVDGVSFNMYQGQIFALLGHNGAGKTTTISMITGLFDSTEGTTNVFGMDIQSELEEIRKSMGVCPQHDILFDQLTVKEHLELYAVFKGVEASRIPEEVQKTIEDLDLGDKTNYLSKNLSGGQKRKLSIGIAFIGGSKFILLDEPSSGMDTSARRKMWDMLKNYKHNRVVLLTTHFMDEADYLGDRIGIMADGQLKCLGSSLFLKTKFGVGYNLTMVKKDINNPSQPIKNMVMGHVPEGKVLSDVSAELAFQLPLESAGKFKELFDDLDSNLEKLKVSTYGISVTTLEEVFLNVAKITTPNRHFQKSHSNSSQVAPESAELDVIEDYDVKHREMNPWKIFTSHFFALIQKRIKYFKRDKKGLLCEVVLPILMVIFGILIAQSAFGSNIKIIPVEDEMYGHEYQVGYNTELPSGSNIDPAFLEGLSLTDASLAPSQATTVGDFDQFVVGMQGSNLLEDPINIFSVFVETYDDTNKVYEYTALIDTRAQEGSSFALNKVNNAILRSVTGRQDKTIRVINSPFERTTGTEAIYTAFRGILYGFVFATGMSFIPASLITFIVKEREVNAKHQQIVSGVSLAAYWLSNFFVDLIKYMIPAIINALMAMAFNADALIEGEKLAGCWAVFILYGFAIIPFVYLTAFLFRDYGTAQIASFFFNFGTGFIGALTIAMMRFFEGTENIAMALHWILRLLPTFSMTYGFANLANMQAYSLASDSGRQPGKVFDLDLTGGDCLFMVITAVGYFALVFLVEHLRNRQSITSILTKENSIPYVPKNYDSDVEKEIKEIEASDNKTYSIKVDKLRKVYALGKGKHKVAVDRLSFGVKNGECFALLGVNGAGKTTTFKILSGDYVQTSGKAYINGFEIPKEIAAARQNIGYCPQFDSILELLTAKEHLELYATIKGIPKSMRARIIEKHLREMNLKQYENIPAGTYSGGNKRKLSVAIAMIGNPSVVFLDEPSTGMDPEARRFMWNVISRISRERKQSSIILTTHSMEEAEALATKMGIMVNGNLKCLGTSQHIKSKYGGGYEIEVKLNPPSKDQITEIIQQLKMTSEQEIDETQVNALLDRLNVKNLKNEIKEEGSGSAIHHELKKGQVSLNLLLEWILIEKMGSQLQDFLTQNFGQMVTLEHFQTFYRFRTTSQITVGNFFGLLEAKKTELNILQYSIKQGTIEQIFNSFAVEDKAREEARIDIPN